MAYYASGSISAYKKLRKIVDGCFSDPTRRPFVSLMKTRGYSCVHGIQMIFYGLNTWGCGILAAVFGGKE